MKLLIDTHVLIWAINGSSKLPLKIKQLIEDKSNQCFVSIASVWELGLKFSLGRLVLNTNLESIIQIIEESGFDILPVNTFHILRN